MSDVVDTRWVGTSLTHVAKKRLFRDFDPRSITNASTVIAVGGINKSKAR